MNCQFIQLAGAPEGYSVGQENRAYLTPVVGGRSTIGTIAALLGAFTAALAAEEAVLAVALPGASQSVRAAIEAVRVAAREAIEAAVAGPMGALDRAALLGHAIDLEGADAPLVARIAATIAAGAAAD